MSYIRMEGEALVGMVGMLGLYLIKLLLTVVAIIGSAELLGTSRPRAAAIPHAIEAHIATKDPIADPPTIPPLRRVQSAPMRSLPKVIH